MGDGKILGGEKFKELGFQDFGRIDPINVTCISADIIQALFQATSRFYSAILLASP